MANPTPAKFVGGNRTSYPVQSSRKPYTTRRVCIEQRWRR